MVMYVEHHVQVAGASAVQSGLALSVEPDLGPIVNSSRDRDSQLPLTSLPSGPSALCTRVRDGAALTATDAARVDLNELAEDALVRASHLSRAVAVVALRLLRFGLASGPLAAFADVDPLNVDVSLDTEDGFLKRDGQPRLEVVSAARRVRRCPSLASKSTAKERVEDVSESTEVVEPVEPPAAVRSYSRVPESVIVRPLLRVREYLVCLVDFLEAPLRALAPVAVGVELKSQLSKGLLDVLLGGIPGYAKYVVIVALAGSHRQNSTGFVVGGFGTRVRLAPKFGAHTTVIILSIVTFDKSRAIPLINHH